MRKYVLIAAFAAALCSCAPHHDLVILHLNDTHSHFEPVRGGDRDGKGGCIERAAIIDSVRKAEGAENVLLLHAGDFSQGTSYFSELDGELEISVINSMGYDCVTLGNHELDNGPEALAVRFSRINCPVVCANLDLSPFEVGKYVTPYAVVERAGRRIGIIGLETDISTMVSKTVSSRIQQFDNVEVTNKWAEHLRKEEKCDLVILLSHIGYKEDIALIPQIHNVDIVIGGHSHTYVEDFEWVRDADGHKVPVIQAGDWGLEIGKVTVSGGCGRS